MLVGLAQSVVVWEGLAGRGEGGGGGVSTLRLTWPMAEQKLTPTNNRNE